MANTTDTTVRVRVKIAVDQQKNSNLAHRLNFYLTDKGMDVTLYPLSAAMKGEFEYPNYQWLILVLFSDSKLANLKETVDSARDLVTSRQLQGVLAITDSDSPDQIANLWPTLRIYDAQDDGAMQEAFEKISRTLSYTRLRVFTSESGRQVIGSSTQAPAHRVRPRLTIGVVAFFVVALIAFGLFGPPNLLGRVIHSPTPNPIFTPSPPIDLARTPSPTSEPTATPDPQTLFNTITNPRPTMSYPLTISDTPSTNDWQNGTSYPSCILTQVGYNIIASNQGQYVPCMLQNTTYQDFAFQVQMQISPGGAGGLIFRSDKQISTFYRFSVDEQGNYILLLCSQCSDQKNDNAQQTVTNHKFNASNHRYTLTVIAKNKMIYLYIGKTLVYQGTDSISIAGEIGLYAASLNQSETAIFTAAKVWKL
jgi:hypothetical protein